MREKKNTLLNLNDWRTCPGDPVLSTAIRPGRQITEGSEQAEAFPIRQSYSTASRFSSIPGEEKDL